MAFADDKTKTTYASTDWHQYGQGRPVYPASLTDIITAYHGRHDQARWDRLVDIGAGSGIASTNFIPFFDTVHISDPSPANEDQARAFLSRWLRQHGLEQQRRLEFSQATGEEAYKAAGEQQADLVICATAAHFMDPDGLALSIARTLRPGGTLAVYSYWMPTFPDQPSPRLQDTFIRTFDRLVMQPLEAAQRQEGRDGGRNDGKGESNPKASSSSSSSSRWSRLASVCARRMAGNGVLDSFPLPAELFDEPTRVYINAGATTPYRDVWQRFMPTGVEPGGPGAVSPRDTIVRYETGVDAEAGGWAFSVDRSWLPVFIHTFRELPEEEAPAAYAEWDQVFAEECPGGFARIQWPVYLVLARRR
ncbi:hypothetical protein PG993_000423 [Apiospora rasikravindrae]|uniref:Methyltransferase type 11 domain-containing protein n=1 Tax=Apiospora rasikravindrae TaxID=990691 RepID=A0ABR1U8H7_9PEZI